MARIVHANDPPPMLPNGFPLAAYAWETTDDLGKAIQFEDLSCSIRSLQQGAFSFPYHFHHHAEELFIVISGAGELRTPDGIQVVGAGDIALFEKGETGAHQLYNPHPAPLVYLDIRSLHRLDVCEYPDTGKVNILPQRDIFTRGEPMGYFDGEDAIHHIWEQLRKA